MNNNWFSTFYNYITHDFQNILKPQTEFNRLDLILTGASILTGPLISTSYVLNKN